MLSIDRTHRRLVALVALACLMVGCATPKPIPLIAHRGASHDAPENTLAAFELAWEKNADGIEGDFYLTSDQRIVCLHDKTTKRTAGRELVVADTAYDGLGDLDVGSWKDERYAGERIPALIQVLETVPRDRLIYIEIKCGPEIVPVLAGTLDASDLPYEQAIIISFRAEVIAAAKAWLPQCRAYWLTGYKVDEATGEVTPTIDEILATLAGCSADGLGSNAHDSLDSAFVGRLERAGYELHVWTIDDPATARRFHALGAASITTNRPAYLRNELHFPARQP